MYRFDSCESAFELSSRHPLLFLTKESLGFPPLITEMIYLF